MFKVNFTHWIGGDVVYWYEEVGSNLEEMKSAARTEWASRHGQVRFRLSKAIGSGQYEVVEEFTK